MRSIILGARENALATGFPVAVLLYPNFVGSSQRKGRVIVYQDACRDFFTRALACGVAYATYDPAVLAYGQIGKLRSRVLESMDLPPGVIVGPVAGMGVGATAPAPLSGVKVDVACSFCGTTGGAIQFDSNGRPSFYSLSDGTVTGPLAVKNGASLSLGLDPTIVPGIVGQRTLVILSSTGAVVSIGRG